MSDPLNNPNLSAADRAEIERSRAFFNAQRGLAFRPDAMVTPDPFAFLEEQQQSLSPAVRMLGAPPLSPASAVLLSPAVRQVQPVVPHASAGAPVDADEATRQATAQEQARGAVAPAAQQTQPAAATPQATAGGTLDNAIEVLAALTGQSADAVRREITTPESNGRIPDINRTRAFMQTHKAKIDQSITPESLARMPDAQRNAVRSFLASMGHPIDNNAFGTSPQQQGQALSQGFQQASQDGGLDPSTMFMMLILGALAEAFGLQGAFGAVLGMMDGANTLGYRTGGGGMGTRGAGRTGAARFSSEPELERIAAGVQGRGTLAGVVNLANALDGQREVGNNGGAIVRATMGYTGDPWCGGFVRYVFEKAGVEGVYNQSDYRMARSYMHIGQQHGAFRGAQSGYVPKPGDVITFSSSRGPQSGHVGIVTAVHGDQVTYMSGNDNDQVQARTISLRNPPGRVLGYTDTEALARAKGVNLQRAPEQVVQTNVQATQHNSRARDH